MPVFFLEATLENGKPVLINAGSIVGIRQSRDDNRRATVTTVDGEVWPLLETFEVVRETIRGISKHLKT